MIFQILFYLSLAAIAAGCLVAAWTVTRRPLKPFARNLLILLILFEIVTAAAHLYALSNRGLPFWDWFFDLQYEYNLGSIFSALQLGVVAVVALINAFVTPRSKLWQRLYWLLLFAIFTFLSIDEFYSIHETLGDGRTVSEFWRIPYAIGGSILALTSIAAWWFGFRRSFWLFAMLGGGLAVMGVAGIGVEEFVMRGFVENDPSLEWMYVFEEVFEMVGATIILAGFLSYTQDQLSGSNWVSAKRILVVATVGYLGWLLFALLFQSGIEARYFATPVDVHYENGLSLVGYRMSPEQVKPGDEVTLTLYWRADQPLPDNYSLSIHALSHPDIASVAQSDDLHIGPTPSTAWFPGVVMKRTVFLQLPRDLQTPESYWLLVRVWSGPWPLGRPWEDTNGVPLVNSGDRATIAADGLILDHLIVLSPTAPPEPPSPADFTFPTAGLALYGYELPQEDITLHRLPVSFWWRTTEAVGEDWTQFFHLVPAGGGETVAFDGKPFGDSFPTADWPAAIQVRDSRTIDLPDSLAPGAYDVYTGLYLPDTGERAAVTDGNGQPVANNAILLGRIDYAPVATSAVVEASDGLVMADYCFAIADLDLLRDDGQDVMVAMNKQTGEAMTTGRTGTTSVEGATMSADGRTLYTIDDLTTHGQFVAGNPLRGWLEPVGTSVTPPDEPARNVGQPPDALIDIDGIATDPTDGRLWAVSQDEQDLFELDPDTGMVIRDRFGEGNDFIHVVVEGLPDGDYIKIEDLAIDPDDGAFYVIAASEDFVSRLARIDFDTLDRDAGTVQVVDVGPFVNAADGVTIADVEGLSFDTDGTLYALSTNNSNVEANYDVLWRVDPATMQATRIGQFGDYVDYVDFEALACATQGVAD